ncbi:transmembrane protein 156 [Mantella aurantiaca]
MAKSSLLKIFLGIVLLLVVCIPEWFINTDDNAVYLSCNNVCFEGSSCLSTLVSKSIMCVIQENNTNDVKETVTIQNNTVYIIHFSIHINNAALCEQQGHSHSLFQDMKITENTTYVSLEVRGKYLVYSEESHLTLVTIEDRDPSLPISFEIHVTNTTGLNMTIYDGDSKHKGMKNHDDVINISLKFEPDVPYYKGTLGIIWLSLIPLVFVCGVIFVVCKVIQEKKIVLITFRGNKYLRSYSAPMLPVIAEHLETDS